MNTQTQQFAYRHIGVGEFLKIKINRKQNKSQEYTVHKLLPNMYLTKILFV